MAEDQRETTERSNPAHPSVPPHEPIPGEWDGSTLTHREPGAIGGRFNGDDLRSSPDWIDDVTAREHEKEGGGREEDRKHEGDGKGDSNG